MRYTPEEVAKNRSRLAALRPEQQERLQKIELEAIARFRGTMDELEAALGMLRLGHHVGWKPLVLVHNKRTLRKFEDILGIKIREEFAEEGPSADRSLGYRIALTLGNFWKAVSGEVRDDELKEKRRLLE